MRGTFSERLMEAKRIPEMFKLDKPVVAHTWDRGRPSLVLGIDDL